MRVDVVFDPIKLWARLLHLAVVHTGRADKTRAVGGSYLEQAGERYTLRGLGRVENADDVLRIQVGVYLRAPVHVRDIGTVVLGALPRNGAVTYNGKEEVVSGMVLKLKGADSRAVIAPVSYPPLTLPTNIESLISLYDVSVKNTRRKRS